MENTDEDYLTNLSWLKASTDNEEQSTGDRRTSSKSSFERVLSTISFLVAECVDHSIDDDLQCLCWVIKIKPTIGDRKCRSLKVNSFRSFSDSSISFVFLFVSIQRLASIDSCHSPHQSSSMYIFYPEQHCLFADPPLCRAIKSREKLHVEGSLESNTLSRRVWMIRILEKDCQHVSNAQQSGKTSCGSTRAHWTWRLPVTFI